MIRKLQKITKKQESYSGSDTFFMVRSTGTHLVDRAKILCQNFALFNKM